MTYEVAPMAQYEEAVTLGVQRWMDANKSIIMELFSGSLDKSCDEAIDAVSASLMIRIGKFLDANKDAIIAAAAAAVASSWYKRNNPPPPAGDNRG